MSVIFSRECEYALQAVMYIAMREGEMVRSREMARRLRIPYHFLGKILQRLTGKGLLVSSKGPSGGFALSMPTKDITLFHIVDAIDGVTFANRCVLGFPDCSGKQPCAVHEELGTIRESIYNMLVARNVSQLGAAMQKPAYKTRRR